MRVGVVREELAKTLSTQLQRQSPLADRRVQDSYDMRVGIESIEGNHIQSPWLERLPIYDSFGNLNDMKDLIKDDEVWVEFIEFLNELKKEGIGHPDPIIFDPYKHQATSVKEWWLGKDVVVSTGTGSGKTECFLWPLLGHLWRSRYRGSGGNRGVKALVLYPMNALATDQMKRIRLMFGNPHLAEKLAKGGKADSIGRFFQFMLYTGRTYSHGPLYSVNDKNNPVLYNHNLKDGRNQKYMEILEMLQQNEKIGMDSRNSLFKRLYDDGFLPRIGKPILDGKYRDYSGRTTGNSKLTSKEFDTELIFRHEAHNVGYKLEIDGEIKDKVGEHHGGTPDLLFTNYSMLDYMLNRPIEDAIWEDTKDWLDEDEENKLLIVLDEAHMYHGMLGLHIAHLIRRLYLRLGLNSDGTKKGGPKKIQKIQFIMTSASLGNDEISKNNFHSTLTSRDKIGVEFISGEQWVPEPGENVFDKLIQSDLFGILENLPDYAGLSEIELTRYFSELLDSTNYRSENWFREIRDSNFFSKFYELTRKPIRLEELEEKLWSKSSKNSVVTQNLLDLLTSMQGKHPGTGQNAPLVSIRAHILTRGLPRLHASIARDKWTLLDGPQPILESNDILDIPRPNLLLGCRSCGCPYIRVWLTNLVKFLDDDSENKLVNSRNALQSYIDGNFQNRQPKDIQIRTSSNDAIGNSVGLDLYPLQKIGDDLYIIGATDDNSRDRRIKQPHGWLNRFDGRLFPNWRNDRNDDDWIPVLFPTKSNSVNELVELNSEISNEPEEFASGAIYTFNFDSQCVRCNRTYSRRMTMDQIVDFESRGDTYFANLTKKLLEIQSPNENSLTPNKGRKILSFSDSVSRASSLPDELQRISNIDEFRHLLLLTICHPWYKDLPSWSKDISKLYPYFVLHSTALEKEPLEHKPSNDYNANEGKSFSVHRSLIIAAYLSEILKEDPDAVRNAESSNIHKLADPMPEVESFLLDRIFMGLVLLKRKKNPDFYSNSADKTGIEKKLKERSKLPGLHDGIYQLEDLRIRNHVRKLIKDSPAYSKSDLSLTDLYWRIMRLTVTKQEDIDPSVMEILSDVKFEKSGTAMPDLTFLFIEYLKKLDEIEEEWDTFVEEERTFQSIRFKLESYTTEEIGRVGKFIINFLVNRGKDQSQKIHDYSARRFTSDKIWIPPSFVGSIARILGQNYNSIDQIGLAYTGLSEEAKRKIAEHIDSRLTARGPLDFIEGLESFGIYNRGDDKSGLIQCLDLFASALVRQGTVEDARRGAAKFSLFDVDVGFYPSAYRKGKFHVHEIGIELDTMKQMLRGVGCNSKQANFIFNHRKDLLDLKTGEEAGRQTISPSSFAIYPLSDKDPLVCCEICSRPHPHPADRARGVCRWCRDNNDHSAIKLVEFDPHKNSVHRQRIEEPWRKPYFSLKPGDKDLNSEGITIIRAEEHTSQIGDLVKENRLLTRAIEFEMLFQDIPFVMPSQFGTSPPEPVIDILCCTTTMEVGIDIGSLVAVALRTIPPDAAQYQQRVGRAGRKRSQVCVALSWFDNNQYSQAYYHDPAGLLNHPTEAPKLYRFNEHVTKQHIRLAILGLFTKRKEYNPITRIRKDTAPTTNLMDSHGKLSDFFSSKGDNFETFKQWLDTNWEDIRKDLSTLIFPVVKNSTEIINEAKESLISGLEQIESLFEVN